MCRRPPGSANESGSALVEMTWLGVILLVPFVYVVLAVFQVQSAAYGTSAAARSAARAFVLAPDPATAQTRAREAAGLTLQDHGVDGASTIVVCRQGPCMTPGSTVHVEVTASVPLPLVPDLLGGSRAAVVVRGEHDEPYGRFREDRS